MDHESCGRVLAAVVIPAINARAVEYAHSVIDERPPISLRDVPGNVPADTPAVVSSVAPGNQREAHLRALDRNHVARRSKVFLAERNLELPDRDLGIRRE